MEKLFTSYPSLDQVFTPEQFDETNDMIASTAEMYAKEKVFPMLPQLNEKNFDVVRKLMLEAGELGLIGADIPEENGGLDLGKVNGAIISEKMALGHSFAITFGGQTGIGALPIAYFGNEEQKERYLPAILTGEKIAAYALTEPSSGTDALSLKTTAVLDESEQFYVLNGEKQWITNSGFADIFIVYARVNDKVTAFIVDGGSEGLSTSNEEVKMGLEGSSTRSVILDQVKVPTNNVIGEVGKGHYIAFNVLNIGRYKISATSLGSAKRALQLALQYGNERKQFNQPLTAFELIKYKLAQMSAHIYAVESTLYRIADEMQQAFEQKDHATNYAQVIAPFATKCSLSKILATESLDFVVDEALQIHGGYGYMKEYEIENIYRDVRINRIFEGTNEINRIIVATDCMKGNYNQLDISFHSEKWSASFERLTKLKEAVTTTIVHFQNEGITNMNVHQTVAQFVANCATTLFAIESALLRLEKAFTLNKDVALMERHAHLYMESTIGELVSEAMYVLAEYPNEQCEEAWRQMIVRPQHSLITMQNDIANALADKEHYPL